MMQKVYQELDLPDFPINNAEKVLATRKKNFGYSLHLNPEKILYDDVLKKFCDIGVTPGYIVFFTNLFVGDMSNRWTHSDVRTVQDPRTIKDMQNVEWKSSTFGINFEIYNNKNNFNWYETSDDTVSLMPVVGDITNINNAWLSGIHYGEKRNTGGVPVDLKLITSKKIGSKPILVRTDIPHNTTFRLPTNNTHRVGASIRFYEDWSWNEALEIFKPLFADVTE